MPHVELRIYVASIVTAKFRVNSHVCFIDWLSGVRIVPCSRSVDPLPSAILPALELQLLELLRELSIKFPSGLNGPDGQDDNDH